VVLFRRFRLWIIRRLFRWEEFWVNAIPSAEVMRILKDGKPDKDYQYYVKIAGIMNNAAFMNELAELQDKYDKQAAKSLILNDMKTARVYIARSEGVKSVNAIILNAKIKIDRESQ